MGAQGQPASSYTGTASITGSDPNETISGTGVTLVNGVPTVTFVNGVATFQVTFGTAAQETLTVTDSSDSSITGTATVNVTAAVAATQYSVCLMPPGPAPMAQGGAPQGDQGQNGTTQSPTPTTPAAPSVQIGTAVTVQVMALGAQGQPASSYTGTASITGSDPNETISGTGVTLVNGVPTVTFVNGVATFQVTFGTAAQETLTVTDSSDSSITGTATVNVTAAVAATQYSVCLMPPGPAPMAQGGAPQGDQGQNGTTQSPTPTTPAAPSVQIGTAVTVQVMALGAQGQPASSYTGTASITGSDPNETISGTGVTLVNGVPTVTFVNGVATFQVTFGTAAQETLTVTDSSDSSITGTATVNVTAAVAATQYSVCLMPPGPAPMAQGGAPQGDQGQNGTTQSPTPTTPAAPSVQIGTAVTVQVMAPGAQGQPASSYTGTASITGSDPNETISGTGVTLVNGVPTVTFVNGVATFQVTFGTAAQETLTVTDSSDSSITGTATVNVTAAVASTPPIVSPPSSSGTGSNQGSTTQGQGGSDQLPPPPPPSSSGTGSNRGSTTQGQGGSGQLPPPPPPPLGG